MQTFRIPRYNYRAQFGPNVDELISRIRRMILDGHYILSEEVEQFEADFAKTIGVRFARGVNTGTDALALAMRVTGVGPGSEVITQANTFNATVAAIELVGAQPVLVDAEEGTFLMDQGQVEAVVTERTRAIIPVHLFGKPTPMTLLLDIARRKGLSIIEDAAQAHGARWNGRCVGGFGRLGCFSFHPSKNLAAAGDGGAVVTDDEDLALALSCHRALGQTSQNDHILPGLNTKLDSIQAAILSWKLNKLEEWNEQRARVAQWYRERLADLPVSFQSTSPGEIAVYHLFQVRTPRRDELVVHLRSKEVDAVIRYPLPIHLQPAFQRWKWKRGQFPVAEKLATELVALPIRPEMEVWEVDYVTECMRNFFKIKGKD
jgi:dTDP-4-amino-4,6-dideoxygalactose transaminase